MSAQPAGTEAKFVEPFVDGRLDGNGGTFDGRLHLSR
jgi:hypothetical protein